MYKLEKIIEDLKTLNQEQLEQVGQVIQQELILLKSGIASTEPQWCRDIVPIDVPIEYLKKRETGFLYIRYPYTVGLRSIVDWREIQVTQAAQVALQQIFSESILDDLKAGRIQTISTTQQ